jgi:hypothetical protein
LSRRKRRRGLVGLGFFFFALTLLLSMPITALIVAALIRRPGIGPRILVVISVTDADRSF